MTIFTSQCFAGLPRGFKEGCAKYGILMERLQPSFQHGFLFMQQVGVIGKPGGGGPPPEMIFKAMFKIHPELRRRVKAARESFESRLWLQDLKDWDEMKKDSIARNTALQSVDLDNLSDEQLIEHLNACKDNAEEMVYRHHKYSVGSVLPVGWFLDVATRGSGLSAAEVVPLLKGSTPVSVGIGGEQLALLADKIQAAGISRAELDAQAPQEALDMLRENPGIARALDDYLAIAGYMLIGGYCISEKTLRESPNIIVARIADAMLPGPPSKYDDEAQQKVRDRIPAEDLDEFEAALKDAREANRMRDERGVYNDIWGAGVARTAILAAGRRLTERGVIARPELLLDASHEEMLGLMRGERPVSNAELEERFNWRMTKSIDEVPEILGDPPGEPPPLDWLPRDLRRTMGAFAAVMGNVFDSPDEPALESISGLPVSPGVYEGIARVILSTREFDRLQEGDVLVTKNTSAGFNVVLPIIGALVTDRGGILSHAAIVSREYGIPGVIGTKTATQIIKEGDRVRVDGEKGEVTVLP
jgi:pyruvate,water dikinase